MNSKPIYHHYGKVSAGKLMFYNLPLYQQTLSSLEGKEFDLILKEKFKRVSLDTHGYYRAGVIKECTQYEMFSGWSEDEIHDFFASMFLTIKKNKIFHLDSGAEQVVEITRVESTGSLSQKEMNVYVESVIRWLAEHGIVIHSPEEYYLGKYKTITDENHTQD